ncbi:MAG: hypothetical protein ACRD18_10015 [Terriglobia bacterium]
MSYTTITNVAGMFPAFQRGTPQQRPADTLIQQFIDDAAGDMDAILQRRFGQVITDTYSGNFAAFQGAFSKDAQNALEKINRYGAAGQLGQVLSTFGVASAERLAIDFQSEFKSLTEELSATSGKGEPGSVGLYDHLFDPQSATASPRPGLIGIAGGDQFKNQTSAESGMSNFFGKFDRR